MEFILDTNAYRNLVKDITLADVWKLSEDIKSKEDAINSSSAISIVVAMELIQHLENGDPFKEECFKALCLQYLHTTRNNPEKKTMDGSYYPPMNVILARYFFNDNSKYFPLYLKVLDVAFELVKNNDISNCDQYQSQIITIKNQVIFEKNEFKTNVESLLTSMNNGILDWQTIRSNKAERKTWFEKLQNGNMVNLLGIALMFRAYQVMEIEELIEGAEIKLQKFIDEFKAALIMNSTLLEQIGHGTAALANVSDHRWNTLNDVQILFAVLFDLKGIDKKLVSDEKQIKESCIKAGLTERVITLNEYKKLLDLI